MSEAQFKLVKISTNRETLLTGDLLVGRLVETGLALTEGFPSRRHAQITMNGADIWVEDLGSANGTFVNGTRIAAKTQIKVGDRVLF
jgi:pSer/pThr/pTyr-binding forkhead associated (FHA) protein